MFPPFADALSDEMFWEAMSLDMGDAFLPPSRRCGLPNWPASRPAAWRLPRQYRQLPPRRKVHPPAANRFKSFASCHQPSKSRSLRDQLIHPFRSTGRSRSAPFPRRMSPNPSAPCRTPVEDPAQIAAVSQRAALVQAVQPAAVMEPRRELGRSRAHNNQPMFLDAPVFSDGEYEYPPIDLLQQPQFLQTTTMTLKHWSRAQACWKACWKTSASRARSSMFPGPVVTLYEFEPAPASSRPALSACRMILPARCLHFLPAWLWCRAVTSSASNCPTRFGKRFISEN